MMTIKRAERLTGYEIRRLPDEGPGAVRYAAFDGAELVAAAEHLVDGIALKRLVQAVFTLHCRQVLDEQGWRCSRCGRSRPLQIHHRRPRSLGGTHRKQNLEPVCWECHRTIHARGRFRSEPAGL